MLAYLMFQQRRKGRTAQGRALHVFCILYSPWSLVDYIGDLSPWIHVSPPPPPLGYSHSSSPSNGLRFKVGRVGVAPRPQDRHPPPLLPMAVHIGPLRPRVAPMAPLRLEVPPPFPAPRGIGGRANVGSTSALTFAVRHLPHPVKEHVQGQLQPGPPPGVQSRISFEALRRDLRGALAPVGPARARRREAAGCLLPAATTRADSPGAGVTRYAYSPGSLVDYILHRRLEPLKT